MQDPQVRVPGYASPLRRLAAVLVDCVIYLALAAAAMGIAAAAEAAGVVPPEFLGLAEITALLLVTAAQAYWYVHGAYTPGKWLQGLEVRRTDGGPPTTGRAICRVLIFLVAVALTRFLIGLVDYLPVLWRRDRRALHDLAAGTVVRESGRPARVPALPTALVAAVVLVVLAPAFPTRAYYIVSEAMAPTLKIRDRILVNRLSYALRPPRFGEIAIYQPPPQCAVTRRVFVMRIVGLPGDRLAVRTGKLWRNGSPVTEEYIKEPMDYTFPEEGGEVTVPRGAVFVLGDNRNDSNDSHHWQQPDENGQMRAAPFLPLQNLRGRAVYLAYPMSRRRSL